MVVTVYITRLNRLYITDSIWNPFLDHDPDELSLVINRITDFDGVLKNTLEVIGHKPHQYIDIKRITDGYIVVPSRYTTADQLARIAYGYREMPILSLMTE